MENEPNLLEQLAGVLGVASGDKEFKVGLYWDIETSAIFGFYLFLALLLAMIIAKKI
jgi:hypothetical protein